MGRWPLGLCPTRQCVIVETLARDHPALARAWRRVRLVPGVEPIARWVFGLRALPDNVRFRREHPGLPMPPPSVLHRTFGPTSLRAYYLGGQEAAEAVAGCLGPLLPDGGSRALDLLEWGCGPLRILRHLGEQPALKGVRLAGCDRDLDALAWGRRCFPGLRLFAAGSRPPLPEASQSLDLLLGISVFTHLPEADEGPWMTECLRVLRPGGLFLLTVHGEAFRSRLGPDERRRFDRGDPVYRSAAPSGTRLCAAFHPEAYMRRVLLAGFEILVHDPAPPRSLAGGQDLWLVRVPRT